MRLFEKPEKVIKRRHRTETNQRWPDKKAANRLAIMSSVI